MGTHLFSHHKLALTDSAQWESNTFITRKSTAGLFESAPPSSPITSILGDFKYVNENSDNKFVDYFLSFAVALAIAASANNVDRSSFDQDIVKPVQPPKVHITLTQPPKPKPVVIPPPPPPPPKVVQPKVQPKAPPKPAVQKVVPLKPQPVQKVVQETVPDPQPIINSAPTTSNAPTTPAPPAPAVVEEKVLGQISDGDFVVKPDPEYPEIAQERGWEGRVLLKVHVLADGKPGGVSVAKSSGFKVLDDEAVRAAKKAMFKPVAGIVTFYSNFNL